MKKMFSVGFILILSLGLFAGCSSHEQQQGAMPAPLVEVMTVTAKDEPVSYDFVGQTEGSRSVIVRAQVSGILTRRAYTEGDRVTKGQLLFEIEPDSYRAALDRAKGSMAEARAKYVQAMQEKDRHQALYAKRAVSQRDLEAAEATFASAKADFDAASAAVQEAAIQLEYAFVVSPVDGYAGKEQHTIGNLVMADSPDENMLTMVNQLNPINVNFSIPSTIFMRIRVLVEQGKLSGHMATAHITLADNREYATAGKVTFVDKAVQADLSSVNARAEFENPHMFVMPGQFVRVTLKGLHLKEAILIPQKAVIQTQNGPMVIVVDKDNTAQMRTVRLSDSFGNQVLLEQGLAVGERIVIEGSNKAIPGKPVRIASPQKPSTQSEHAKLQTSMIRLPLSSTKTQ